MHIYNFVLGTLIMTRFGTGDHFVVFYVFRQLLVQNQSSNQASERFSGHKSDITTGKISKAVANHFSQPGHKPSDIRFLPFEIVKANDPTLLASREQYWIQKKRTLESGLNRQK